MANKSVVRATIEINGQNIVDMNGVTENEVTVAKAVPLMHATNAAQVTKRFTFSMNYVVPQVGAVDWSLVTNATASRIYDNGERTDWGGVEVLTVGEASVDGEKEVVQKIDFMASTRNGLTE